MLYLISAVAILFAMAGFFCGEIGEDMEIYDKILIHNEKEEKAKTYIPNSHSNNIQFLFLIKN